MTLEDRTARARFAWNNTGGWLWRKKVAAYARRIGTKDLCGLKKIFGPRWAYFLQGVILGERLEGVFPSFKAAMRSSDQSELMLMATLRAERIIENLPSNRAVLLRDKSFHDWPIWAIPKSFGEEIPVICPSADAIKATEDRAREMRLYAARLPWISKSQGGIPPSTDHESSKSED